MSKLLNKLKKIANNQYSFVADEEQNIYSIKEYCDTNCYILNAMLSGGNMFGGVADGKRYMIAGPSSTGKSYFTSFIIKSYLDKNKDAIAVFFESEGATVIDMADSVGIDKSRVLVLPVRTVEECRSQCLNLLKEITEVNKEKEIKDKFIFIIDSLGNLSTTKEISDIEGETGTKDMTRAGLLRGFGRASSLAFSLAQVPLIIVNHTYSTMDKYSPTKVGGGEGPVYMADVVLELTKGKERDESKNHVGAKIGVSIVKSRFGKEGIKGHIIIHFSKGIYPYSDLVEKAQDYGVFKKEGISFLLPDGTKAKMKDVRTKFKDYANEINLNAINEGIKKHFKFGQEEIVGELIDDFELADEEE